jgi:proline-specific peptidase
MYDQLGCGLSDKPQDAALWTMRHYLEELRALMDILELKEVFILGQSWGGMLASEYAASRPDGLRGIILSNSLAAAQTWNQEARRLVAALPENLRQAIDQAEKDGDASSSYQEATMEFYRRHVCRLPVWPEPLRSSFTKLGQHMEVYHHMWGASEFYCDGTLQNWDIRPRLAKIEVPTLLISGEFDEATPVVQRELLEGIFDSEWKLIRAASHMTHLEEPHAYLEAVSIFLDAQEKAVGARC